MTRRGRGPGAACVLLAVSLLTIAPADAATAPPAPGAAMSLYVVYQTNEQLCAWGDALATKQGTGSVSSDALLLLHFFAPVRLKDGSYGASRRTSRDVSVRQVRWSVQDLIACYDARLAVDGTVGAQLTVGVGLTNDDTYHQVRFAHGVAWAGMVDQLATWITGHVSTATVDVGAAFDAEAGFGRLRDAKAWVRGYRSLGTPWPIYYYGGAAGCPTRSHPDWHCQWDPDGIIWLAWGNGITQPVPEIYDVEPWHAHPPASLNAQQWVRLSRRAVRTGVGPIAFAGALSQAQACKEVGGCRGIDLAPKGSWRDLWNMANCMFHGAGSCTTATTLRWTGNISWANRYPGSPRGVSARAAGRVALDPPGIRPAEQGVPGCRFTTTWSAGADAVDAGRCGGDAGVLVWRGSKTPTFLRAPAAVGSLRIVAAHGGTVFVRDSAGTRFAFDVGDGR